MPKVYHPIFRSGEYADKFRTEFPTVKVNIPPISIMKDEISVAGEKEAVLKVKDFINKTVKDMVSFLSTLDLSVCSIEDEKIIITFVLLTPDAN